MVLNVVILTLGGNQYENKILHSHNWNECQCCFCQPQCRVCSWLLFWCGAGRIEILNGRACIAFVRARKQFRRNLLNNKNKYFKVDYQHHNLTVFVIFYDLTDGKKIWARTWSCFEVIFERILSVFHSSNEDQILQHSMSPILELLSESTS